MIDCNEWKTEKPHECTNMGKVKRLELWWQLYLTSLPERDVRNIRPMDFCSTECTSAAPTRRISVTFYTGDFYEDLSINFKFGYNRLKTSGTLHGDPKYVLFLPVTLHRHNSTLFEWNGIRLLGQPRRYKNCANAPQCYVIRTFSIFTLFMSMH